MNPEPIETDKELAKFAEESFKELDENELVDIIHTSVLATAMSKTDNGRALQASFLSGAIKLASDKLGEDATVAIVESANEMSATVVAALTKYQMENCKDCPERGTCVDEEFDKPPTIH